MNQNVYLVVMAGGSGTRFWPKSTARKPKQLLSFAEGKPTLLEETISRFDKLVPRDHCFVVTTEALKNSVSNLTHPSTTILAEPQGRNTAPCVYWAAQEVYKKNPNAVMMLMPSDHYIPNINAYIETIQSAIDWATKHSDLVTLGVKPTRPETGYGYLQVGEALGKECKKVAAFVEKPNLEKAKAFVNSGKYLWNGGMFVWKASAILAAFDEFMPEMKKAFLKHHENCYQAYSEFTATSIDFGVMEKAQNVVTFELDCGWDDLGSWTSLESLAGPLNLNKEGSVVASGQLLAIDSQENIIDVPGKLVATLGVNSLIIVETPEALMVVDKSRAQDIKLIVDKVKKEFPKYS